MKLNTLRRTLVTGAYVCIAAVVLLTVWAVWRNHRTRIAVEAAELKAASQQVAPSEPDNEETDEQDELSDLLSTWTDEVFQTVARDESLKRIVSKYPPVVLHSRHLFSSAIAGRYRQSSYSFNYGTWIERKHGNDVQLQFHNGGESASFQVNMVGGQHNLVRDLGPVDFEEDPDLTKLDTDHPSWKTIGKAMPGHVYHLTVRDDAGNSFHVLFMVVAVDSESKYMAFCWRMLPGGKVVAPRRH